MCGAASAAETLGTGHTFSIKLEKGESACLDKELRRPLSDLDRQHLSIAGKILGMNKISIQGENSACGVLWSSLGVTDEKNEQTVQFILQWDMSFILQWNMMA